MADFLLIANESTPDVFSSISKIACGALIADAVAGLATPSSAPPAGSKPLRVVLDGPLVMDMLNLSTEEHKLYAESLVEMMTAKGVMLAIFDHSVDEMRGSIVSTLKAYSNGDSYGPLAERLRTVTGHRTYAVAVMDTLESRIAKLGITILPSKLYEEQRFRRYFPEERVDQVRNAIGDLHEHVDARIRDSMSVATTARLKGEKRLAESLFDSGTVFVTRNSVLARRANRALSIGRNGPDPRFTIVTDGQIVGVFWFVYGFGSGKSLPYRRLIANCSSAILPKKDVISKIAGKLEGLSPELKTEFEALMTDGRASMCPMRLTAGVVDAIDEQMSLKVLGAMKDELVSPIKERATLAEGRLQERERELLRAHDERRELVSSMQAVAYGAESRLEEREEYFDNQLTQLRFNLSSQGLALEAAESTAAKKATELEQKISIAKAGIARTESKARRTIEASVALITSVPAIVAIVYPDYPNFLFRIVIAALYVASLRFASRSLRRLSAWIVSLMFSSRRSYLHGLEQARIIS